MTKIIPSYFSRAFVAGLCCILLMGCSNTHKNYRIGVSQCSEDIWRDKLNSELRMGAYAHEDVELLFASADDSDARQVEQIDSFIAVGIDLLIVAPNQMATISPAIDRAFDKGIPVIVFERKTNSKKFTAYMGGDNRLMGRQMGEFVAARLGGRGRVVEIMGLKGSSPAIERHEGFVAAISRYPEIELVAQLQGDWTEESGYEAMVEEREKRKENKIKREKRKENKIKRDIDLVFAQNDRMAMGARKAMMIEREKRKENNEREKRKENKIKNGEDEESGLPLFCGIDGLPGEDGGIACVRDSLLEASYIYPTHGDEVLALALDILEGRPYQKESPLEGALVTRANANGLLLQAKETERQTEQIDALHALANNYSARLNQQRLLTVLAFGLIALLLIAIFLIYLYHRSQVNIRRERVLNNLWNLEDEPNGNEPPASEEEDASSPVPSTFMIRFREVVEARMANSELSVEDLAAEMNLSRVQLYRKVKTLTDSSPVELLRTARLNRGYQLLLTTDKTVSEVAYAVGFSSPAYFTKCFKDEFGKVPGEVRK